MYVCQKACFHSHLQGLPNIPTLAAALPPPPVAKLTAQFPYPCSGCILMWDWQGVKYQTSLQNGQSGSEETEPVHVHRGQDTPPLTIRKRLEERRSWFSGTDCAAAAKGEGQLGPVMRD